MVVCPQCKSRGNFILHGQYERTVIYLEANEIVHRVIPIKRIRCKQCKSTHAVFPKEIIPWMQETIPIILAILLFLYAKEDIESFTCKKTNERTVELRGTDKCAASFILSLKSMYRLGKHFVQRYFPIWVQMLRGMGHIRGPTEENTPKLVLATMAVKLDLREHQMIWMEQDPRPMYMFKIKWKGKKVQAGKMRHASPRGEAPT